MSDARHEVLTEIVRVVKADAGLAVLGGRVFDGVPQGAAHPFVGIGDVTSAELDAEAVPAVAHRIELIAVSAVGRREASEIAARVRAAVEGAIAPDGYLLVGVRHLSTTVTGSRDGRSWSGRVTMRVVTEAD